MTSPSSFFRVPISSEIIQVMGIAGGNYKVSFSLSFLPENLKTVKWSAVADMFRS
jgi:hypothetical protein